MIPRDRVAEVIEAITRFQTRDHLRARLTYAALVNAILRDAGIQTVIVGGTAVDTHVSGAMGTSESYPAGWDESHDVDVILLRSLSGVSRDEALAHILPYGFQTGATRSTIRHPDLPFPIDLVGFGYPDDYSPDHIVTLYMEDWEAWGIGPAVLAGPEDILFDYMESGFDTRNQRDWTRALAIAAVYGDDLDVGYLFTKAEWRMEGQFVAPLEQILHGAPLP